MKVRVLLSVLVLFLGTIPSLFAQFPVNCIDYATVFGPGGATQIVTCEGDGVEETYDFGTSTLAMPFGFLITDENNIIQRVSIDNTLSFEGLGIGGFRVYAFSFIGQVTAQIGQDATTTQLGSICGALTTNFIPVTNFLPDAGAIATADGNTSQFVCPDDNVDDTIEFMTNGNQSVGYAYLITDENNQVIDITTDDNYNFSSSAPGVYRVWGVSYAGNLTVAVGDDAAVVDLADECYDLSDNFIEVTVSQPDGATVALANGATSALICVADNQPDVLTFTNQSTVSSAYYYLVTDENNDILDIVVGDNFDFESAPPGICRVWGVSFTGNFTALVGENAASVDLSDGCYDLSDNFIEVNRQSAIGGTVSLDDGSTSTFVCVGDDVPDLLTIINMNSDADNYTYLITDENNIILDINDSGTIDFEGADTGVCRVWGLAFSGNLLAMAGDDAATAILADECFGLSDNFVTVRREAVEGGTVAMPNGNTLRYICPGDGNPDIVSFDSTGSSTDSYAYVITDENGIILDFPTGDSFDFDAAPAGTCLIWGLAFTGNVTAQIGDDAAAVALSDECYDLSDNFITVIRETPEGGTVATEDGETTVYTCPGDGNPDIISFDSTGTSSGPYAYVITDENGIILDFPTGDSFDFDAAPAGNCLVWGLAFTGNVTAQIGDDAAAVALSDDCFDLSDNFITVVRETPDGGTVATEDGETTVFICPGDGIADIISFDSTGTSSGPYAYVITDENGIILDFPTGDSFDFDAAPAGTCLVWGLAFTGNVTAQIGDDAAAVALSDDCFDLSDNFITVVRETPDGGTVATEDGETTVFTCPGDGNPDIISFDSTGTSSGPYAYVITDENGIILDFPAGDSFDFDAAPAGTCLVWGLAFTGNVTAQIGDDAAAVALSDDCFDLSDNFITVIRETPDGGTVATEDGATTVFTCPGDGNPDIISFDSTGTSSGPYAYVITDENGIILDFPTGDSFDFDAAPAGTCLVWGLAFTGNVTAQIGDDAAAVALSDDCFDLSDNFITVVRETPDGGTVATEDGETTVFTCPGDGIADIISFDSTGTSSGPYAYVITDENGIILDFPAGDSFDFDAAPAGTCLVWGLAFTGNVTAQIGDDAAAVALSDDCFDLSDNFITVIRQEQDGGMISFADGSNLQFTCPGDGNADVLEFAATDTTALSFTYVVTDELNVILDVPAGGSFDFDGAPEGICRVWGLAYSGNLTAMVGDTASTATLSDDCYDLSDNFIAVIRQTPLGGTVSTELGEDLVYTCPGDGNPDLIAFDSAGVSINPYTYVITDEDNVILDVIAGDSFDFDSAPAGTCRVWGLSYTGDIIAMVGDTASAVALSDDCFALSDNFVTIIRETPDGGEVTTSAGETAIFLCSEPGSEGLVSFDSTQTSATPYTYVLTDETNTIIELLGTDSYDFSALASGTYRIWGLAYTGNVTAQIGDNAAAVALTDDCFDLSDGFIAVTNQPTDGGVVSITDGTTEIQICPGDGMADEIAFTNTGNGANYIYVVTNEDNVIITTSTSNVIDFDIAGIGISRVWGLAYTGNLLAMQGDTASVIALSDDCFDLSDNFVTVIQEVPEGGTVAMPDGSTTRYICPGDGNDDIVMADSSGTIGNYTYLITDENNVVLEVPTGDTFNFDDAPEGICRIWGLAYSGNLTVAVDDTASLVSLSDDCFDLSDNFITLIRETPEGGTVSTADGDTEVQICPGDGIEDIIHFDSMGTAGLYAYVITDTNNVILDLPSGDFADFDDAPEGTCRVWGLAYTGNITAVAGDDAAAVALTDDCFDLSDNFITVIRQSPEAGSITSPDGNLIDICVGDGIADEILFEVNNTSTNDYLYLITDTSGIFISAVSDPFFDFDNAVAGIYRIYGMSYTGLVNLVPGADIDDGGLSNDCFDLTDDFITINATGVDGSIIYANGAVGVDTLYFCTGDGVPNELELFETSIATNASYKFVVITEQDLYIGDPVDDFENVPAGVYRIIGISYTGNLMLTVGQNVFDVALSDGCYDLSDNILTIIQGSPESGLLTTDSGDTDILVCPGPDGGSVSFVSSTNATVGTVYLLTDLNNTVLQVFTSSTIDFSQIDAGSYLVWELSYTGILNDIIGEDAASFTLATSCYALSSNAVSVNVGPGVDGGTVSTFFGQDIFYTCSDDTVLDLILMTTTSADSTYTYIITDGNNNVIVSDVEESVIPFEGAADGVYHIWGLSYYGDLDLNFGDNIPATPASDSCYEYSENFVTVIRETPDGGTVLTNEGADAVTITVGDSVPDEITFISLDASDFLPYLYVVTDTSNVILDVSSSPTIDFEDAEPGICRVWGLAYAGNLTAMIGDTASAVDLADDCWSLSNNFVTVTKEDDGLQEEEEEETLAIHTGSAIGEIKIAPNPATDYTVISFSLSDEALPTSTLQVLDGRGQAIEIIQVPSQAGQNNYTLTTSQWTGGMYVAFLRNGNDLKSQKFIVITQ